MTRRLAFLLLLATGLAPAASAIAADASTTGYSCKIYSIGDSTSDLDTPIDKEKCEQDNVEIKFDVTARADSKYDVLAGTGCSTSTASSSTDCGQVETISIPSTGIATYTKKIQDLLGAGSLDCENRDSTDLRVLLKWSGTSNGSTDAGNTTGQNYNVLCEVYVDTVAPPAPTSAKGGKGENEIKVTWNYDTTVSGASDTDEFTVYYTVCHGSSGVCGQLPSDCGAAATSSLTQASDAAVSDSGGDASLDSGAADAGTKDAGQKDAGQKDAGKNAASSTGSSSSSVDLSDFSSHESAGTYHSIKLKNAVAVGEKAAVVVVAVDKAGNQSAPSNVACIQGVPTMGFCDLMKQQGKGCKNGCAVAAVGAESGEYRLCLAVLMWVVPLLFIVARRRRA